MKDMISENVINEIKKIVKEKYPDFKGVYFYGSRVKGNHRIDSDYDIVLVFDREIEWRFEKEVIYLIYDFMLKYDIVIDCTIYSEIDILDPATPFRENVKKQGLFYAA